MAAGRSHLNGELRWVGVKGLGAALHGRGPPVPEGCGRVGNASAPGGALTWRGPSRREPAGRAYRGAFAERSASTVVAAGRAEDRAASRQNGHGRGSAVHYCCSGRCAALVGGPQCASSSAPGACRALARALPPRCCRCGQPRSHAALDPLAGHRAQLQPAQRGAFRAAALRRVAAAPRRRTGACDPGAIRPDQGWRARQGANSCMQLALAICRAAFCCVWPARSGLPAVPPLCAVLQRWRRRRMRGSGRTPSLLPRRWTPSPIRQLPLWRRRG